MPLIGRQRRQYAGHFIYQSIGIHYVMARRMRKEVRDKDGLGSRSWSLVVVTAALPNRRDESASVSDPFMG
jgi:hypothetical protein